MTFLKKVIYLLRKNDYFVPKSKFFKEIHFWLRKYDLLVQVYDKVTPKWGKLIFFECFWGNSCTKENTQGDALTVRIWGGGGLGEGRLFKPLSNITAVVFCCRRDTTAGLPGKRLAACAGHRSFCAHAESRDGECANESICGRLGKVRKVSGVRDFDQQSQKYPPQYFVRKLFTRLGHFLTKKKVNGIFKI